MLGIPKKSINTALGAVLRRVRKIRGLSQEGLAFEAGLQRNYISLMELGTNQPTITTIFKVSSALKIEPHELIAQVEEELKEKHSFNA
ncbi:helix-turn-helix domain-containing protein [Mesorhizobium japonicum]|uniref:helix-turn-helix domain-containing protein n=1 Tax=Mesorhizobium japonicum TaxID=2066070 RepID=UPI003B597729